MKYIALVLILASQALAGPPVWLHAGIVVGFLNKDIDPTESWGELDLENLAKHQQDITITARRWDGRLVSEKAYNIAAGGKLSVKVEDPAFNMDVMVERGKLGPEEERCAVVIKPAPPTLLINARQLTLHGDKLTTLRVGTPVQHPQTRFYFPVGPEERLSTTRIVMANITGKPETLLICQSVVLDLGCLYSPERITVPAFTSMSMPFPYGGYGYSYLLVMKPKELFVGNYHIGDAITSTFEVESGVTFGLPVEKKDKL